MVTSTKRPATIGGVEVRWRGSYPTAHLGQVKVEDFYQVCEQLRQDKGSPLITPEEVVDAARPAASTIHKLFDWRNSEAAEKWRQHQARSALHSVELVEVVDHTTGRRSEPIITNYHVVVDGQHGYVPAQTVALDEELGSQVLLEALSYLRNFRKRYSSLKELSPVMGAIAAQLERWEHSGR